MTTPDDPILCPACEALIAAGAAYCSKCGTPLTQTPVKARPSARWYHNMWFVLLMISPVALGPFGLPLLWKSPRFSQPAKLGLTLFTLAWTIWAVTYVMTTLVPAVMSEVNRYNAAFQF